MLVTVAALALALTCLLCARHLVNAFSLLSCVVALTVK